MRIKRAVYDALTHLQIAPPETGGILGLKDGIISYYIEDRTTQTINKAIYIPDITFLNHQILEWQKNGIFFAGIFHTHMSGQKSLSSGDIAYIYNILNSLKESITVLYFPVIIPKHGFYPYKAYLSGDKVLIKSDTIHIN